MYTKLINMGYIYKVTNLINKMVYIGKTILPIEERWEQHLYIVRRDKAHNLLHEDIVKYGPENFHITIIDKACSDDELIYLEEFHIDCFAKSNIDKLYNRRMPTMGTKQLHTPQWLFFPWINRSEVFRRLSGSESKSKNDYYTLKMNGSRSWKEGELEKLEIIRKELICSLESLNSLRIAAWNFNIFSISNRQN